MSFGHVVSDVYQEDVPKIDIEEGACPFRKRRHVDWFTNLERSQLDPYLYRLFYSQHVVTNANDYAPFIDRALHTFFRKGDQYYTIIRVTGSGALQGRTLTSYLNAMGAALLKGRI